MWLLDDHYDVRHRAYAMAEQKRKLKTLKLRFHGVSSGEMSYDERYTPYIETLGLLPFIQLVSRSTPNLNATAITALVDRWRPETHSFHLWTGEMTVILQDVSMIFALPINGQPLCMSTDSDGWHEQMAVMIGIAPVEEKSTEKVPASATYGWIVQHFKHCPPNAEDVVVRTDARVYTWYVLSRTLFADSAGRVAQWMWLKALTLFESRFSWGSTALAYLYRQLDDACFRLIDGASIGGPMVLLSVEWEPYGVGDRFAFTHEFRINPMCLAEGHLWIMQCPLICMWAVELQLPHRVMRQFGQFQPHPPEWEDTDRLFHVLDRKKQRKIKNWDRPHSKYITKFRLCLEEANASGGPEYCPHSELAFTNYVRWFNANTRVEICPPAYEPEILEEPNDFDELARRHYNKLVKDGTQTPFTPVLNFVKEIKKQADETEEFLDTHPVRIKGDSAYQSFLKRQYQKIRWMANILGCLDAEDISPLQSGSHSRSQSRSTPSDPVTNLEEDTTSAPYVDDAVITKDDMTLREYQQRPAYMLKPRRSFHHWSPDDWRNKGKGKAVAVEEPPEETESKEDPEQFVRRKLRSRRGR